MKLNLYALSLVGFSLFTVSCAKKSGYTDLGGQIIKQYNISMATTNENHAVASPYSVTTMTMEILDSKTINYEVFDETANRAGDYVTNVEIRLGDPISDNGTLLTTLPGKYRQGWATGVVPGLRASLIDTLLNNSIPKYVNVITNREPLGLVRGQINADIVFSNNTILRGDNFHPAVVTPTTGLGLVRVTTDLMLYSKILIDNDEAGDLVNGATLNSGNVGENTRNPILTLASSAAQLTSPKIATLTAAQYTQLLNSFSYISVTSPAHATGKIGGQVK